jgi:hypothetical protein
MIKHWYFPENNHNILDLVNNNKLPVDGLIFQSKGSYQEDIYKWKSLENLTIDFYLQLDTDNLYEAYVFKFGMLYKTNIKVIGRTIFTEELHRKVVECKYIPDQNSWVTVKIRDDKVNPNSYQVLDETLKLLKDPITLENLIAL